MILVTGATGSIGRHLVRRLQREGVPFRALVRDETKGKALGCDFVVGDFDDEASIASAMRGVDRLFLNAGGARPVPGEQPMIRQQKTVIDAARSAGVSRVVKISVWHAREGGRLAEGAHGEIERHLRESGLAWSVLRPSAFMQNFVTGAGTFTADGRLLGAYGDGAVSYIDCQDIADCAAVLLTGPYGRGEIFVLTGPHALTQAQVAGQISDVLRRPVEYVDLSPAELSAALRSQGLPAAFADDVSVLSQAVASGALSATTTTVRDLTGRPPRTFTEFLTANLDALRAALPASSG